MSQFFEDLDETEASSTTTKAFFEIDHESDKDLMQWFTRTLAFLKNHNQQRLQKAKNNYARYKGIQYREQVFQPRDLPEKRIRYMPQMVVPLIADVVDEKVARLLEVKPSIQVIPQGDEQSDKVDAKVAKKFLKHIDYIEDLDKKFRQAVKSSKIAGESFLFILWNKDKGASLVGPGEEVEVNGKKIKWLKEGDVEVKNVTTLQCLYEMAKTWSEVEYIFFFDYEYTSKLKREFPEKASSIHESKASTYYDFETMNVKSIEGKTATIQFYHKKTKFLPGGFDALFCNDVILRKGPLMYNDGALPLVRFVDVENEEEVSGESFIEKVKAMSSQYNNLTNMIIKQINLCAHPKWFVEGNTVDDQSLGNDTTIVRLAPGSNKPILGQTNPVSQQTFEFRANLKQEFYEQAKSNSIVRGDPPPGVTAFVAMQYLSESENRRLSNDTASVNSSIKDTYDLILKRCGQFYKKGSMRNMLILGKDNRWDSQEYSPEELAKPYRVLLQNSSALPESKALRTQFVLDMGERFPNMFPQEQIAEMLDLGQSEKMMDLAGMAARAAEDENEMILDGKSIPDPEIHESLIAHWKVHVSAIQDIGFKMKTSEQIQVVMKDHIKATEMLMFEMIMKSQAFAALVNAQCPQFPLYFEMPAPPPMPLPEAESAQITSENSGNNPGNENMLLQQGDPAFSAVPSPQETGVSQIPIDMIPQ